MTMPRAQVPASNFTSDRHVLYAGWVLGELMRCLPTVTPIRDTEGNYTNRVTLTLEGDATITLLIPPPPDDWDILGTLRPIMPSGEPQSV